jgi:hypothetical protein
MGILTYQTFLLDVVFKKKLRTLKDDLKFPRGQCPRRNGLHGVIDLAEMVSAGSLTPLKRKFDYNRFSRRIRGHMRNGYRP